MKEPDQVILDLRESIKRELDMQNKPNLTFSLESSIWNDRPQLIAVEQMQVTPQRSSVHHIPHHKRIVHVVPKNDCNKYTQYVVFIFHKDDDPHDPVSTREVFLNKGKFRNAMIAKERYSNKYEVI